MVAGNIKYLRFIYSKNLLVMYAFYKHKMKTLVFEYCNSVSQKRTITGQET